MKLFAGVEISRDQNRKEILLRKEKIVLAGIFILFLFPVWATFQDQPKGLFSEFWYSIVFSVSGSFLIFSINYFAATISQMLQPEYMYTFLDPVSLIFILGLWASFPIMFRLTRGIVLLRRVVYVWVFCTNLALPLFFFYLFFIFPSPIDIFS